MNPDTGEDAEDWFAKFEREAREAAQQRDPDPDAAAAAASSPPPVAPQLANPFDAPPAAPVQPAAPLWEPQPPLPQQEPQQPVAQPPLVEPPAPSSWDVPTQAVARQEPEPTQAMPSMPSPSEEPTQALVPAPLRPPGQAEPGSGLDSLFGESAFREYESTLGPDPSNAPFINRGRSKELVHVPGQGTPPPPRGFGRPQKILAGVGGGLLAVIAIIALFLLGTRLPDLLGPAPAVATPTPTPTPTMPAALPIGPVEPGTYDWDELLGGECLEPYDTAEGAWGEEYTVVDCAEPHGAQMVFRAWYPAKVDPLQPEAEPERPEFPGAEALAAEISLLCSAPGVVDLAAAGVYTDAQIQGSYPVTAEQWDADPSYYCFVSRSSGEPLTGSVAIPRVAPADTQPSP